MNNLELKKIREELGLSQQELSDELDVNIRTIQKWEAGESKISKGNVVLIERLRNNAVNINESNSSGLSETELKELAYKVAMNEDQLMGVKVFSNIIEIRVAKRLQEITSSEEAYKKWRNS